MKSMLAPEVKEWAEGVIDELCANGFDDAVKYHKSINPWSYDNALDEWIDENAQLLNKYNASVYHGASKACIVFSTENWVIKTNYRVEKQTELTYGEIEVRNYIRAEEAGLEEFFAKTYEIGWRDEFGMYFYVQEKAGVDESEISERFYDYVSSGYDEEDFEDEDEYYDIVSDNVSCMDEDERLFAVYGDDNTIRKLCGFVNDNDINDLHEANFGINLVTGRYIIIDFSGF